MAWDYGNLRWQLQFQSRNKKTCRIDIYKRGYSQSTVTQLTGSDTPVSWDEDNNDDLLSVYRTKTGYINLIETSYGDLRGLYPTNDIENYVEVYYINNLVFSGFMQAQDFENNYEPAPRVIKFPIMSPLEIAEGKRFSIPSEPSYVTLGKVLKEACTLLQANISQVIFPTGISIGNNRTADLTWLIQSLIYCPYNKDYDEYKEHEQNLYTAESIHFFIEGLCNCFGLMVHDYPGMLVFTKIDYAGTYGVYNVSSLDGPTITPVSTINTSSVTDYTSLTMLSDKGKESSIMPLKKLIVTHEGEYYKEVAIEFTHAKMWIWLGADNINQIIYKYMGDALYSTEWNYTDYLPVGDSPSQDPRGLWMAEWGVGSMTKKFLWKAPSGLNENSAILRWRIYYAPHATYHYFEMTIEEGTVLDLHAANINLKLRFKNGDYYYDGTQEQWTTSSVNNSTSVVSGKVKYLLKVDLPEPTLPLDIYILAGSMYLSQYVYALSNINFNITDNEVNKKAFPKPSSTKEYIEDNGSNEESGISQAFNVSIDNYNQVISPTESYKGTGEPTNYAYMFTSRRRFSVDTMLPLIPNVYLEKVKFDTGYPRKKIISVGFTPSEDEMAVTMQNISSL